MGTYVNLFTIGMHILGAFAVFAAFRTYALSNGNKHLALVVLVLGMMYIVPNIVSTSSGSH